MRQRSEDQDKRNITVIRPDLPHSRPSGSQKNEKIPSARKKIPEIARAGICIILSIFGAWVCLKYIGDHSLLKYENATYFNLLLAAACISMMLTIVYGLWFVHILLYGDTESRKAEEQRWKERNQKAEEEQNREYHRLIDITGAEENWTCDQILVRLREQKRHQSRYYPFRTQAQTQAQNPEAQMLSSFISRYAPDPRADTLSDTIFRLERIAKRRNCNDDNSTSSDTIIGYEHG